MWQHWPMRPEEFDKRWLREEFLLLERSPEDHDRITSLLTRKDAGADQGEELNRYLDRGLEKAPSPDSRRAAAELIWSRLKGRAEGDLAVQAEELIGRLPSDPWAIVYLKKVFKILAARQDWKSFLESSYLKD